MKRKEAPRPKALSAERVFCYVYRTEVEINQRGKRGKKRKRNLFTWCHVPVNYARRVPVEILFTVNKAGERFLDYVFPLEKVEPTGLEEIQSFIKSLKKLTGSDIQKSRIDWGYAV